LASISTTVLQQQQQQPFYGPLSGTTRVSWYQKKHSPIHHPDHSIFISFFHLPRSIASSRYYKDNQKGTHANSVPQPFYVLDVKALKETPSMDPNQWPGIILPSSTTKLMREGALVPLCLSLIPVHTHKQLFYCPFSQTTRVSQCQKSKLLDFMVQGKITEVDTPTIQLGTTPSRLISDQLSSSPHFSAG